MDHAVLFGVSKEALLALLTGVFAIVALSVCVRGMMRGTDRPYLLAWVVRLAICLVALGSQFAGGASYSLVLSGGQVFTCLCIIILVMSTQPRWGRLDWLDWSTLAIAAIGVSVWVASGNPLYGLLGALLADACATAMGVRASLLKDKQESLGFWICCLCAASAAIFAAGTYSLFLVLAPAFSAANALVNLGMVLYIRRRKSNGLPVMLKESQPVQV